MPEHGDEIEQPCVRNCCLDEADVCMGCFRTLKEILAWHGATAEEKREILRRCEQRRSAEQS
ncbi:putative Fe-S protein YdhL (DUF1289 family) [Litorivivens lipolytica]|uniref:Putative Fe-S protein YdhL (DUF1289 family) n=1 Tax=Litorivivens lipolytica TaxID=1524264 RepID=A0A7W4W4C1_9GAMM|nr:putative Fe-S protein YdhL (DUF1289 family) [Litorivivens lipolytica]